MQVQRHAHNTLSNGNVTYRVGMAVAVVVVVVVVVSTARVPSTLPNGDVPQNALHGASLRAVHGLGRRLGVGGEARWRAQGLHVLSACVNG